LLGKTGIEIVLQKQTLSFEDVVSILKRFRMNHHPVNESEIERGVLVYLSKFSIATTEQEISRLGRYDVTIKQGAAKYCIELKKYANKSCVEQIDRYSIESDGIILLCWKASTSIKGIFSMAKPRCEIPIELIEIRNNCEMV
jgi:hypothetical protein